MDLITPAYTLTNDNSEAINYYIHDEYSVVQLEDGTELSTYAQRGWSSEFIENIFETLDPHLKVDFYQKSNWNGTHVDIYSASLEDNIWGPTVGFAANWGSYYDVVWEPQYELEREFDQNTIIHEIGHALGLQHPDGEGFNPNFNQDDTVMSYNSGPEGWRTWFSEHDINALQSIWGIEEKVINGGAGNDNIYSNVGIKTEDFLYGHGGDDSLAGFFGPDALFGGDGEDFLHGNHGKDYLDAGIGNDTIRGGHGHDEIFAGSGSDWVWGGIGKNTVDAGGGDGNKDEIFVPVDQVQNENGNLGGVNADILKSLGSEDRIFMHGSGISDSSLTYEATSHNGMSGIGIYANGTLEALVTGYFDASQIDSMTTGGFFA